MANSSDNLQNNKLLEQWKVIINVQMHFNDMIIRTRTLGITVVVAVYGAAAAAIGQFPNQYIYILGATVHISIIAIFLGLLLLSSIYIIDHHYYYRLLIGAVEEAEQIESMINPTNIVKIKIEPGLTRYLTKKVSRLRANSIIFAFYGFAFIFGICFFIYILGFYSPITK